LVYSVKEAEWHIQSSIILKKQEASYLIFICTTIGLIQGLEPVGSCSTLEPCPQPFCFHYVLNRVSYLCPSWPELQWILLFVLPE
jgi:hypothetical protein